MVACGIEGGVGTCSWRVRLRKRIQGLDYDHYVFEAM